MTQTIKTRKKECFGIRQFFLPLLCTFLLISSQAFGQSKLVWQSGTPLQSSNLTVLGADGYLDLNFQVKDADITNASVAVTLPPGIDYVGVTNQAGMTATVGTIGKTGSLAAGWKLTLPITSSAKVLKINDIFSMRIGIKAACSVNITSPGQFSVTISGTGGTITDGVKTLSLSVRKPTVRLIPMGGNSRDYATIGETQNFKLALTATNGTANSVVIKLIYPGNVVTLDNFKIGAISIPSANITINGTTTKTTTIKLTLSELGSPIDETVKEISFDAVSNLGCDRTIQTQVQFDAVNNCETINCESLIMKLPSEAQGPTFTQSGYLQLDRDWSAAATGWDQFCFDGTTPGYAHFILTNNNNVETITLKFHSILYLGSLNSICAYIDTADIYYRINGGSEVKVPKNCITAMRTYSAADLTVLSPLYGKVYYAQIQLPEGAHIPAGGKIEFRHPVYANPAWNDLKDREWYDNANSLTISGSVSSATNICGNQPWSTNLWSFTPSMDFPRFTTKAILHSLKPNTTGVLSNLFMTGLYNSTSGTNGTGRRATEVFVKLPSWMSLDYTTNITEAFTFNGTSPIAGTGIDHGDNTYSVLYDTNTAYGHHYPFNIKFKTGACNGSGESLKDTVRIWADFISGTPTTTCRPRFQSVTQLFQPVVFNCNEKGMMMDALYLYRQTRGLRDSDNDHYPDDGSKALDSEINHSLYTNADTGYFCVKGHIKGISGDTYEKLYTRLKLMRSPINVQLKFGTGGDCSPIWDQAVINVKKQGIAPAISYPLSIPIVSSSDSIYVLYDGVSNSYLLQPEDSVELRIPFIANANSMIGSDIVEMEMEVESYAMNTIPSNPFLPEESERFGSDLLKKNVTFVKDVMSWNQMPLCGFNSLTTPISVSLAISNNIGRDFLQEVRYFYKPQSAVVKIPYGYELSDGMIYAKTISRYNWIFNSTIPLVPTSRTEDPATGDSIYTVDLTPLYDYDYDGSSPVASGKVYLGDDQQGVQFLANLLPSPAFTTTSKPTSGTVTVSTIHHLNGNVNSASGYQLFYYGPGLSSSISPTTLNVVSEDISLSSFKVVNNGTITAKNVWVYVEGNARDARIIVAPGDTLIGEGLNGRWVKVGDMAAKEEKDYKLDFIYVGGNSCGRDSIRIHCVVDFLGEGFNPDTSKPISAVKLRNKGPRQILVLNNSVFNTKIAGSVKANVSSLIFNTPYVVDAIIDGQSSQGALTNPKVTFNVPTGQLYKENSATIEYPLGVIKPVSTEVEQLLKDAFSAVSTLGAATRSETISLAEALGRASIMLPGWGASAALGYTDSDRQAILHMTFIPKCETPLTGIRYKGVFTGKTTCGSDAIDNGTVTITNPSIYTTIYSDYDFGVSLSNVNSLEKVFSPEKTTDVISATFTKVTNVNTMPIMTTDSIQLILPKQLDINGNVTCTTFPGITIGSNIITGDIRTITLSLPAGQLNTLMATNTAGAPFTYDIPVKYTADDQSLAVAPLQSVVAQVVTNLRFDPACYPKPLIIGAANMNMLFVTFSEDPYLACKNLMTNLEITSTGTTGNWYKEASKTTLLASAATSYNYTPLAQTPATFYVEAKYNNIVYGMVPITVNMNPEVTVSVNAPVGGVCIGNNADLTSMVTASPSTATVLYYQANKTTQVVDPTVIPVSTTMTYYAQATDVSTGCMSPMTAIVVIAAPVPTITLTKTAESICSGNPFDLSTLVSSVSSGCAAKYYSDAACSSELSSCSVGSTGTYYLLAENSVSGCQSASQAVSITLKTPPTVTITPSVASVFVGEVITYSTEIGMSNYSWTATNGSVINATSQTSTVTWGSIGIGSVTVTYENSEGCTGTQTLNVTVKANDDATLKDLSINGITVPGFDPQTVSYEYRVDCNQDQVILGAVPNNILASLIEVSPRTAPLVSGDNWYSFTVTAEDGVTTKTYSINIIRDCYVPKILKDLEDAVICVGDTHTFEIQVEGQGLTYEWYYGLNRIMGANTNTYTVKDAVLGDYERYQVVIRSNHNGFKSSAYSKKVRLWVADYLPTTLKFAEYPNPATTGSTYHIKVDGYIDVTKYTWSYDKEGVTFSPGADQKWSNEAWATFGTLSAGIGTLKVTMEHPCGIRELTQAIIVKYPTGTDDVTTEVVQVYPNPTSGVLKVLGTEANQTIRIADVTGSLKGTYKTQEGTTTIDMTGYAKGTYMVQYNGKTYKVIKK